MKRPDPSIEPIRILEYWQPRGVIHVGANDGEEFVYYKAKGIKNLVGFEPLEKPFRKFHEDHPDVLKFNCGWGSKNTLQWLDITENDKASSALKRIEVEDWTKHPVFKDWNMGQWPIVGQEAVVMRRYEDFVINGEGVTNLISGGIDYCNYDPKNYNFLNMDIQGMELEALKGMGDQLNYFDALVIECSETPVYVGEASAEAVTGFLRGRGFERVTPIKLHNDVLFLRKDQIDG